MRRILAAGLMLATLAACGNAEKPCPTEDSAGPCVWNAKTHGNGLGQSVRGNADQSVTYLP